MDTVLDGSLDSVFADLGQIVSKCVKGLGTVNDALTQFAASLAAASQAQQQQQEKDKPKGADMGAVMDLIPASIRQVAARVNQAVAGLQELAQKNKGADYVSVAKGKDEGGGLAGYAAAGVAVGGFALALQAGMQAIQGVVSAVRGSVEALSPSTIMGFDRAMRDMTATVGVAFAPIFEVLTGTIRQISAALLPMFDALAPVMRSLAESVGNLLVPIFKLFAGIMEALMPVFRVLATVIQFAVSLLRPVFAILTIAAQAVGAIFRILEAILHPVVELLKAFAPVLDAVGQIFEILGKVFKALFDTIMPFITMLFKGLGLGKIFEFLVWVIGKLIQAVIMAIATLAKLAGANDFIKNMIAALEPKAGATAAVQNVGIKGLEQISKDMATASAGAAGKAGEAEKDPMLEMMKESLEFLKTMADIKNPVEEINEGVRMLNNPKKFVSREGQKEWVKWGVGAFDKEVADWVMKRMGD